MCEINRNNFLNAFPYIADDISRADFIAIDTEFSGLRYSEEQKSSLFDDGEARYHKLRVSVSKFTLSQIGLAIFIKEEKSNTYLVHTYNIYLFPYCFGPIDVRFFVQASSFDFLCRHNFDFNKFVYEGVPFLNAVQEVKVREHLATQKESVGLDREVDERSLQRCCSVVAAWLITAEDGATMDVPNEEGLSDYTLLTELRQRFLNTWASKQSDGQIVVQKVNEKERKKFEMESKDEEIDEVLKEALGFTRIFWELVKCEKPMIGHNNLTDLMFMYDKFYKPLPTRYSQFKKDLHTLFPQIYDTKHICTSIRKIFRDTGIFEQTNLSDLHQSLETDKGRFLVLFQPNIKHADGYSRYVELHCPHEAGYDAFMCGNVFIKVAHILALHEKEVDRQRPLEFHEQIAAVGAHKNSINIIRGSIDNMNIDRKDPISRRPQWLYVTSKKTSTPFNSLQLAQKFSAYGSVDICMQSPNQALVAMSNVGTSRDILRKFWKHESIYVVKYSMWRHSPVVRKIMWTGVLVSGGVALWVLLSDRSPL